MNGNLRMPNTQKALEQGQHVLVQNNIKGVSALRVKITTTSQGAKTNLLIFPGPTPNLMASKFGCTIPDQSTCTFVTSLGAGDANGLADFYKFIEQNGLYITGIQMVTSATNIYDGSLFIGEMPPNGIATPEEIYLSTYAASLGGGGYDKTLNILDRNFSNTRNFFMYLSSMPASATIDIIFNVAAIGNTFAALPV